MKLLLVAFTLGVLFGVFDHLIYVLGLYAPPLKAEKFPVVMYLIHIVLSATVVCLPRAIVQKSIRLVGKALLFGLAMGIFQLLWPFITMSGELFLFVRYWTLGLLAALVSSDAGKSRGLYGLLGGLIGGSINLNLWLALFSLPVSGAFWSLLLVVYYGFECTCYWFCIATGETWSERRS